MKLYLCCGNKTGVSRPEEWVGVDNDPNVHPDLLADVRALTPSMFPDLEFTFATPRCDGFTDIPWRKATGEGLDLLMACWDFCQDSGVPWLLENSRFAQKYLGRSDFRRGPHHFWCKDIGLIPDFYRVKSRIWGGNPLARAALPQILA
jgi:hypothetical protein